MKTALVTGGTGFLGSHLCDGLLRAGYEVVYTRRDSTNRSPIHELKKHWQGPWHEVAVDVRELSDVERVLSEYGVDVVFHLAAQAGVAVASNDPTGTFRTNIAGTMNVLEACRRQKTERVVIASTDKVYGEPRMTNVYKDGGSFDFVPEAYRESDTPLSERTPYGASKICSEILAETYHHAYGMSIAVTRCGNLYGPGHMNFSTLIPGTIRKVILGERPVVRFGGEATRDFLHVYDAVNAYIMLAESGKIGSWNFSGGEPKRIIDVVRAILSKLGSDLEPDIKEGASGEIQNQSLDCTLARRMLNWKPTIAFEDGLAGAIEWYQHFFDTSRTLRIEHTSTGRGQ